MDIEAKNRVLSYLMNCKLNLDLDLEKALSYLEAAKNEIMYEQAKPAE